MNNAERKGTPSMRIALIADIHGNVPALEAMAAHLKHIRPDEIWFLGEAVGKGPGNAETCDWVMQHCHQALGGNWDYGIGSKQFPQDHYYWNQLGQKRMDWLASLPRELNAHHGRHPVSPVPWPPRHQADYRDWG